MPDDLRILRIILTMNPEFGGPVEGIIRQTSILDRSGVQTTVATLDHPESLFLKDSKVKCVALGNRIQKWSRLRKYIPWMRYNYSPHFVRWIRDHAKEFDVVMVHSLWSYAAFGARRALVGLKVPYVVLPHGSLDPWFRAHYPKKHYAKQLFWLFSEGPLLNNADAVLFTTEEEKKLAEGMYRPYRINPRVIPYGTADAPPLSFDDVASFREIVPKLGQRPYFLFLSRIHQKKGCDLLIEAFANCAASIPDTDLVIAGPDQMKWQAELNARAERLNIAHRIHWPGMLSGTRKWAAYRGAEAFILPSHSENFGIVVAEALACGTPVLISDKVNIWREIAEDGGGIVASDTLRGTEELISRFAALTQDERNQMGRRARTCFLQRFHLENVALNLIEMLREVAGKTRNVDSRSILLKE